MTKSGWLEGFRKRSSGREGATNAGLTFCSRRFLAEAAHSSARARAAGSRQPCITGRARPAGRLIGQQGHLDAASPSEQHGAGKRVRAETLPDLVQRGVERLASAPVERQRELNRAAVVQVGDRNAD